MSFCDDIIDKRKDVIARKIVANLCNRYRRAKRRFNKAVITDKYLYYDQVLDILAAEQTVSWNAYESSRRILFGEDL